MCFWPCCHDEYEWYCIRQFSAYAATDTSYFRQYRWGDLPAVNPLNLWDNGYGRVYWMDRDSLSGRWAMGGSLRTTGQIDSVAAVYAADGSTLAYIQFNAGIFSGSHSCAILDDGTIGLIGVFSNGSGFPGVGVEARYKLIVLTPSGEWVATHDLGVYGTANPDPPHEVKGLGDKFILGYHAHIDARSVDGALVWQLAEVRTLTPLSNDMWLRTDRTRGTVYRKNAWHDGQPIAQTNGFHSWPDPTDTYVWICRHNLTLWELHYCDNVGGPALSTIVANNPNNGFYPLNHSGAARSDGGMVMSLFPPYHHPLTLVNMSGAKLQNTHHGLFRYTPGVHGPEYTRWPTQNFTRLDDGGNELAVSGGYSVNHLPVPLTI